ncbi:DUF1840 domain-containing protein [Thiosocius teredinicola]|uniref:DUF1840 domain-containing protein n=1 Tax=Thiosocius teredinicola TaxID=1973002 RepID=UPI0009911BCF
MLVTFSTPAYADITMFGDVAAHLLKLMGHSGTIPSALLAEDVPAALQRLQAAVDANPDEPAPSKHEDDEDDGEAAVTLRHRAMPLIELLKSAARDEVNVMWDKN